MDESGGTEMKAEVRGVDNRAATEGKVTNYGVNCEIDKESNDYKFEHTCWNKTGKQRIIKIIYNVIDQ